MTDESVTKDTQEEVKASGVTEDMMAAAAADLKKKNEQREADSKIRTFSRGGVAAQLAVSDLYPLPAALDLENIAPVSYLAQPEGDITGNMETQQFSIIEDRLKGLLFDVPNRPLEKGRSARVVKWIKWNGTLSQLPFESQINNTAAGSLEDAIGVRKFQRRGVILYDFETQTPVYCFARNCWAAAMVPQLVNTYPQHVNVLGSGYCSRDHFMFVEPGRARRFFNEGGGRFEVGATTTRAAK